MLWALLVAVLVGVKDCVVLAAPDRGDLPPVRTYHGLSDTSTPLSSSAYLVPSNVPRSIPHTASSSADSPKPLPCAFTIDFPAPPLRFDLCPLLGGTDPLTITSHEETPPTHTDYTYTVGRGAPVQRDRTMPDELQCAEGTWVCLQVINSRPNHPSEPPRVLQVVPVAGEPGLRPTAKRVQRKLRDSDTEVDALRVVLHGGSYTSRSQKAVFDFICASETTPPTLSWTFNGTHAFEWSSEHACGKAVVPTTPPPSTSEPPSPTGPGDDGDTENPPSDPESPDQGHGDINRPAPSPTHPLLRLAFIAGGLFFLYYAFRTLLPKLHTAMLRRKARRTRGSGVLPASRFAGLVPAQFVRRAGYEPLFDAGDLEDEETRNIGEAADLESRSGARAHGGGEDRRLGPSAYGDAYQDEASPLSATFPARGAYGAAR
ncbi:uncharacterized protein SCHCODRAFT_02512078 [Schizophyllum commune H4-8]|uniref:Uncharacterized protein n=1 Tax=Schizophyllum commune (strain H4-8 / FGSC 9210) TaxID=578458 RepID=D8QEG8_SCHCM|nr:uncharacterized protein SCHCODRAFT_02512078 [Schizophyllum commune H4-8]KAI5888292.1 hypothetical protein SCHCODRAFT_02512078 [Schizophyllum commune H4-8]